MGKKKEKLGSESHFPSLTEIDGTLDCSWAEESIWGTETKVQKPICALKRPVTELKGTWGHILKQTGGPPVVKREYMKELSHNQK